jgi:hypothetical protein
MHTEPVIMSVILHKCFCGKDEVAFIVGEDIEAKCSICGQVYVLIMRVEEKVC